MILYKSYLGNFHHIYENKHLDSLHHNIANNSCIHLRL